LAAGEIIEHNGRGLSKNPGTYALLLLCRDEKRLTVGKLGEIQTRKGFYVYVGSALGPGGVFSRVQRHFRALKSCHWHMDYLRPAVEIIGVWFSHVPQRLECRWADLLMKIPGTSAPFPGFGSSDCGCRSHLIYFNPSTAMGKIDKILVKKSHKSC
jgi:Uri superfamily endonuclease